METRVIIQTVLFVSFGLIAIVGNSLVAYAIICMGQRRSIGHFFILSLTLSDLYLGLFVIPMSIAELHAGAKLTTTTYWCKFTAGVALIGILGTSWNLVIISIDRFIYISKPFCYKIWLTPKVVIVSITSLWMVIIMWASLPLFGWAPDSGYKRALFTLCVWPMVLDNNYFNITLAFVFIAVFVVAIFQGAIFAIARKQARSIHNAHTQTRKDKSALQFANMQRKATRIVGIIVGFFMLTYLPWLCIIGRNMLMTDEVDQIIIFVGLCLIFFNSVANPWIYTLSDKRISSEIKRLLRCGEHPNHQCIISVKQFGAHKKTEVQLGI